MIRVSRLAMIAAVAAALATPAFAQSFDPEAGTGNVPPFSFAPTAAQSSTVTVRQGGHGRMAAHRSGLHAFAMVPGGIGAPRPAIPMTRRSPAAAAVATTRCSCSTETPQKGAGLRQAPFCLAAPGTRSEQVRRTNFSAVRNKRQSRAIPSTGAAKSRLGFRDHRLPWENGNERIRPR